MQWLPYQCLISNYQNKGCLSHLKVIVNILKSFPRKVMSKDIDSRRDQVNESMADAWQPVRECERALGYRSESHLLECLHDWSQFRWLIPCLNESALGWQRADFFPRTFTDKLELVHLSPLLCSCKWFVALPLSNDPCLSPLIPNIDLIWGLVKSQSCRVCRCATLPASCTFLELGLCSRPQSDFLSFLFNQLLYILRCWLTQDLCFISHHICVLFLFLVMMFLLLVTKDKCVYHQGKSSISWWSSVPFLPFRSKVCNGGHTYSGSWPFLGKKFLKGYWMHQKYIMFLHEILSLLWISPLAFTTLKISSCYSIQRRII